MVEDLKGKRVVLIGGAGFIGSHIVDQLIDEPVDEIIVYDNFTRGKGEHLEGALRDRRVKIYPDGGDVLHRDILERAVGGADYVFHLAALWLLQCYEYPESAFEVNIRGTFNVLEACRKAGVKKVVFSSSASVYGDAVEVPMSESHPFNNRTFYGATKIAGEQMFRAYFERYGLNYVGLRYMNVYGERQDYQGVYTSVIMKILDRLDEGKPPVIFGDGTQSYDFVNVKDVARANILALKADVTDRFYNVGTGRKTSVLELTKLLMKIRGFQGDIEFNEAGQTFVTHRVGDTTAARNDLGFEALVDLESGLRDLVEWRERDKCADKDSNRSD